MIWSGNSIVTKSAAVAIDPASITLYRWVLAFLLLTPFVGRAVWRQRRVVRAHWARLAVLGILGMATYQGLAYVAARTTSATDMGIILALMPLLSALLAGSFAGERITARRVIGALASLAGLLVMTTQGDPTMLWRGGAGIGDALMLVAVLANSLYGVLLKRWAVPLSTWQQLLAQIGFAILVVVPFWLISPMAAITPANAPLVVYAGTAASLGAPFLWITGVKRFGPSRAALFLNLLPPIVALLAWAMLGERLTVFHAIGGLIALLGVRYGLGGARVTTVRDP
jgi:drug/metabolite transporter (DMT)-like permease